MNKIDIVISLYNEKEVDWIINDIPENFNIYLYHKSCSEDTLRFLDRVKKSNNSNLKIFELPNIGRESDTYLHHIIQNYNDLADFTIFTQAEPHPHSPDFSKLLTNYNSFQDFQPLTDRYLTKLGLPTQDLLDQKHVKDKYLNGYRCGAHLFSLKHLQPINYFDLGAIRLYYHSLAKFGLLKISSGTRHLDDSMHHTHVNVIEKLFNECGITLKYNGGKVPSIYFYCIAACFAVKKDRILNHSVESYQKLKLVNIENSVVGYLIERSWPIIFGPTYDLKTLLNDLNISNLK